MIAERAIHDMVMAAIAAAQSGRPMPGFDHLPYFPHISREQMHRLNRSYDEARNQHATKAWRWKR